MTEIKVSDRAMDKWSITRMIDWAAGEKGSQETKDKLHNDLAEMTSSLAGINPTPMEMILAETAALNWFALRMFEAYFAGASNLEKSISIAQSDFHQRRIDRAHRRLLTSLKTLAVVRRLAVPNLQINLAQSQVNFAGNPTLKPVSANSEN